MTLEEKISEVKKDYEKSLLTMATKRPLHLTIYNQYDDMSSLATIMLSYPEIYDENTTINEKTNTIDFTSAYEYTPLDITSSIELNEIFFDNLDPNYCRMFKSMFEKDNPLMHLRLGASGFASNCFADIKGEIDFEFSNSVVDAPIMAHEVTHALSANEHGFCADLRGLFMESGAILAELLMHDQMLADGLISNNDLVKMRKTRIALSYICSTKIYFETFAEKIFHKFMLKNPSITVTEAINNYLASLSPNSPEYRMLKKNGVAIIENNLDKRSSFVSACYVWGTVLAIHLREKILEDPNNIKSLHTIISFLRQPPSESYNRANILEEVGIPCIKNGKFSIDNKDMNMLLESYESFVADTLALESLKPIM